MNDCDTRRVTVTNACHFLAFLLVDKHAHKIWLFIKLIIILVKKRSCYLALLSKSNVGQFQSYFVQVKLFTQKKNNKKGDWMPFDRYTNTKEGLMLNITDLQIQ